MRISDFTAAELDTLRHGCNFTNTERQLLELRNQEYTLEQCADRLHVSLSTVNRLHRRIKSKITRVLSDSNMACF